MGLDDHVERQVLMLQGREQGALGALHEVTEGQPITLERGGNTLTKKPIRPSSSLCWRPAVSAPTSTSWAAAGLVHQPLERRQQRAVQGHPGLGANWPSASVKAGDRLKSTAPPAWEACSLRGCSSGRSRRPAWPAKACCQ
jgi:hypothetical protein